MPDTKLTFLGTAAVLPGPGEDTASYLINDRLMIDCGWYGALKMQQYGYDPMNVETLFFTHCHHDHYMGLPGLLFFRGMRRHRGEEPPPLTIVGPPDDLPLVVELSRRFLQADRFPSVWSPLNLVPLEPGSVYETDGFRMETIRALHPVTGVSGRFTDKATGAVIALSGDTGPNPALVDLARDADLLIHEASVRPDLPDDRLRGDHSRSIDAARAAREAGVKRLCLVHMSGGHDQESLAAARAIFPETELPEEGETVVIGR
jgi:ribonuclease Z